MEAKELQDVGQVTEICRQLALAAWCKEYSGSRSDEEALVNDTTMHQINVTMQHGGRLTVSVTLICRQPWKSETYYRRFQRIPGSGWQQVYSRKGRGSSEK